ncbi:MAG: CcmD family protein [Gemmatimonadetes bacterium]|nr:CcmD family protein [Gemmatimonadota bacterium]
MMARKWFSRWTTALLLGVLLFQASPVWAQAGTVLGRQTLGRAYWHVFAAYAVVWLLVLGWVISIVRRLRRVEERLGNE